MPFHITSTSVTSVANSPLCSRIFYVKRLWTWKKVLVNGKELVIITCPGVEWGGGQNLPRSA